MYESIRWHARVQRRTRMPFEHTLLSIEFSNSLVFKPSYILTDVNGGAATVWYPPPVSTGTRKSAGPDPRHAREGGHAQMHPNNPRPSSLRTPRWGQTPRFGSRQACERTPVGSIGAHRLRTKDYRTLVTIGRSLRQHRALHSREHEKQVTPSRPLSSPIR
jgi:hypothetical protein